MFTDPTGLDGVNIYKDAEKVYAYLVMVSIGARKRTLAGHTVLKMDRLILVSTRLCIINSALKIHC